MAKLIEYDVSDVEESSGGTGVKARPGVYAARIESCTQRTENRQGGPANDLEVALNVGEEYDWVFTYVGLSKSSDWKLAELVRAVGLKEKGKLDPDKLKGKLIRVKLNPGEYNGEYRPEAGRLMPAQKSDSAPGRAAESKGSDGNPDEPEDVDAAQAADDTPDDNDGFEASRERDADGEIDDEVGSYDDWDDGDLEAEVSDRGLTLPGGRGKKRDKFIAALRSDDEEFFSSDGDDDAEPAAAKDDEDGDDYEEWSLDDLTKEYEERSFDDPVPSFRGRNAEGRIKNAIIEALREDDAADPFKA